MEYAGSRKDGLGANSSVRSLQDCESEFAVSDGLRISICGTSEIPAVFLDSDIPVRRPVPQRSRG